MSNSRKTKTESLVAPITGRMIPLEDVPDKVFSSGALGEGVGFEPEKGVICAPCDGKISMIAETLHAFGMESESGTEILVHIGLDTVNLSGKGFTKLAEEGQTVKKGTPVLSVDLESMREKGITMTTPMVITNSADFVLDICNCQQVTAGETEVCVCERREHENAKQQNPQIAKRGNGLDFLAEQVIKNVGGKDNITYFVHCVTRLRFNVKNKDIVNVKEIEDIDGVVGCQWSGEQFQIIIGQKVGDAYALICEKAGLANADNTNAEGSAAKKFSIGGLIEGIAGCVSPLIHVLIGAGMIKIIVLVCEMLGILQPGDPTHTVLTFAGDAGFYFLPVFIGATTARKFGGNLGLGMLVGALLIHPTLIQSVAEGTALSIFGLPIYGASYASTVFPAIMAVYVMCRIEKFFAKISPDAIRSITEPLLTLLVMIPATLCLFGPVGAFLGNYMAAGIMTLYEHVGFLCVGIMAMLWPYIVMTGMHAALVPTAVQYLGSFGFEPLTAGTFISNFNQGAACIAVAIKTRDTKLKSTAVSCAVAAIVGGVTEPALFGINMKLKKPMLGAMIGSFCGGIIAGLLHVYVYAFSGSGGLFGLPVFIGAALSNLVYMLIAAVIGIAVTIIATMVLYKDKEVKE